MKQYTREQWDNAESLPEELVYDIFKNSDGEMLDDNWSEYIENKLVRYFEHYEVYEYEFPATYN